MTLFPFNLSPDQSSLCCARSPATHLGCKSDEKLLDDKCKMQLMQPQKH